MAKDVSKIKKNVESSLIFFVDSMYPVLMNCDSPKNIICMNLEITTKDPPINIAVIKSSHKIPVYVPGSWMHHGEKVWGAGGRV